MRTRSFCRALALAIDAGWQHVDADAETACVAAVCVLEDSPLFNAGAGSALAADGGVWCDATLMCGDGRAGAVAAVARIRHPILAAQALAHADRGPLLWAGRSAELAALHGLELLDHEAMVTERQRRRLAAHRSGSGKQEAAGTVGAVCLDAAGRLAAATSTGGFCGKSPARVGDSAIFGAGTWPIRVPARCRRPMSASRFCACSSHTDPRAHAVWRRGSHGRGRRGARRRPRRRRAGRAICVDARGAIAMPVSSDVMSRAWRRAGQGTYTALRGSTARTRPTEQR